MNNALGTYLLSTSFMLIMLAILGVRATMALSQKKSRNRCILLIGTTFLYVLMDAVFIVCHFSNNKNTAIWDVVSFFFYLVYVILPFVWYVFVRTFVGTNFSNLIKNLEIFPLVVLLLMVVVTPFSNYLWYINEEGMYTRGPGFLIFSVLNYFYYIAPLIDIVIIIFNKNIKNEPYIFLSILISLVPLIGAVINSSVIPTGTIFPFQPFCSVVVALLGFCFIASKDSDVLKELQKKAVSDALEASEAASKIKTRFLSDMSHDIRTPMNAITNLTELALTETDPDLLHEYLQKIEISSNFLLGLINDILDMSRIENGALVLHKQNLTRTEFLQTIETVMAPLAAKKKLNFHPELNPGRFTISVDKLRFNQIFFNLLSNAVKYTPEGGDIWLEVNNVEENNGKLKIMFIVRDNGIGMSEEFLKHIFEPFAREENETNLKTQGTGLGLSIVKNLVDAMDGTITVNSKLGQGSEFIVVFYVDIVANIELKEPYKKPAQNYNLEGTKVLLVEDNEMNSYVEKIILEKAGCLVTAVENGKKAVDLYCKESEGTFDVILMDLRMPVMDGKQATKLIRESGKKDSKTIPIIAMTADIFENENRDPYEEGFNYYLAKPIDSEKLYNTIQMYTPLRRDRNKKNQ